MSWNSPLESQATPDWTGDFDAYLLSENTLSTPFDDEAPPSHFSPNLGIPIASSEVENFTHSVLDDDSSLFTSEPAPLQNIMSTLSEFRPRTAPPSPISQLASMRLMVLSPTRPPSSPMKDTMAEKGAEAVRVAASEAKKVKKRRRGFRPQTTVPTLRTDDFGVLSGDFGHDRKRSRLTDTHLSQQTKMLLSDSVRAELPSEENDFGGGEMDERVLFADPDRESINGSPDMNIKSPLTAPSSPIYSAVRPFDGSGWRHSFHDLNVVLRSPPPSRSNLSPPAVRSRKPTRRSYSVLTSSRINSGRRSCQLDGPVAIQTGEKSGMLVVRVSSATTLSMWDASGTPKKREADM